jgi:formylglycine-generating enzyme required for sulfatase activity
MAMETRALWAVAVAGALASLSGGCVPTHDAAATPPVPTPAVGQSWTVPGLRLKLAYVVPGSFRMGADDGEADERPAHEVRLTRGFWVGTAEVTQAQYEAVTQSGAEPGAAGRGKPSSFVNPQNPVESVSWDDAMAFCATLTAREQAAGRLPAGLEYRLPTEAEWEYAARGGSRSRGYLYSGSNSATAVAWHDANSGNAPHPVARRAPNELGLYDLSGNVWEWCLDGYDPGYYAQSAATDPVNLKTVDRRVFRGGCWGFSSKFVRSSCRAGFQPGYVCDGLGFRVILAAPAAVP